MNFKNSNFRNRRILPEEENLWKYHFLKLIKDEFFKEQKVFELDEFNRTKIAICFDWIVGKLDTPQKGLLLRGEVGTGKSCILKACKTMVNILYDNIFTLYLTADQISNVYKLNGEEFEKRINQIFTCKILFIDDIGYEPLHIFENMPIAEVIRERYDKKRVTCLTTNTEMKEIAFRYNKSLEDKISEMCHIVKFEGQSRRK